MENLDNFRYLPIEEKAEILRQDGKYITTIGSHGLDISLYYYGGLYVEVFHSRASKRLVGVRILEDKKRLGAYARQIDIHTLLKQSLLGLLMFTSYYENA
jgi:hypothetical protein